MIAVKALYEHGSIELLEPVPTIDRALVVVVFLDAGMDDAFLATSREAAMSIAWGEPMDEEGANLLVAVHEELAPYRAEAEAVVLSRKEQ